MFSQKISIKKLFIAMLVLFTVFLLIGCDAFSFYDAAGKAAIPPPAPALLLMLTPPAAILYSHGNIDLEASGGTPAFDVDHYPVYTFQILNGGGGNLIPLDGHQYRIRYHAPHSLGETITIEVMDTIGPAVTSVIQLVWQP